MFEPFGWNVGMSVFAALLLVLGALLIGVIAQYIGDVRVGWEWAATAFAALVGGYLASEAFGGLSTWGPAIDGFYLVPALIGAVVVGGVVDVLTRMTTDGSYVHAARPI
jgi:uncharacterized membrane protein YeaQ/YmgE (transglycosylase-associated protein family)